MKRDAARGSNFHPEVWPGVMAKTDDKGEVRTTSALRQAREEVKRLKEALARAVERTHQLEAANEALVEKTLASERTEEKLRDIEARSNLSAEVAGLGGWRLELSTGAWECSDTCKANFGLAAAEDLSFERLFELIHPDDRNRVRDTLHKAIATQVEYDAEYRAIWPDGSVHWIKARGRTFYAANGTPLRIVGITQNVTEEKRAMERLRESEQRFRHYFELGLIGVAITSPAKDCLEVNDKICEILGFERSELLQKTWVEMTYPDDLAADVAQFNRVMAGEIDGYSMDKRWIRKDGEVIYSTVSVKCLRKADGSVDYFVALLQDITERKQAEEILRQSEARYRTLFNSIDEGFCVIEMIFDANDKPLDYRFLDANPALEKLTGMQNPVGKTARELVPDLEAHWIDIYGKVALTGEPERFVDNSVAMNRWFDVYALRLDGRESSKVALLFHNITEAKRAEEALKQSERMSRVLADAVPDFMWITDAQGRCEFLNQRWFDYTGMTLDQSMGLGWASAQHPDDAERYAAAWQQAREAGSVLEAELCYRRADGVYRWFLCRALPYRDENGVIAKWYGTTIDIHDKKATEEALRQARDELDIRVMERTAQLTASNEQLAREVIERRRAEEELRRSEAYLAEAQRLSHTGSWAWHASTGALLWSDEHFRIFGLDPEKVKPSYPATMQWMHPEDRHSVQRTFEQAVRERSHFELDCRIVRDDGTVRYVHSLAHPVLDESGDLIEYVGTIIDTTERKRAEEALRKTQAELAHVTRVLSLGELTTSIAHEVNQPLAAIVISGHSCLRWLEGEAPNLPAVKNSLNRIIRDGNRAADVIQRIRALVKSDPTERVRVDVNVIIREVLALAGGEVLRNRILLKTELTEALPFVLGTRVEIQQVIINLIINGIEAMALVADRKRKLVISSQPHRLDDRPGILVKVCDRGVGIAEDKMHQVFEGFYTTKSHGLGMGLPTSRTIVESHGGRLWAAMNSDFGVTFQFFLPRRPAS